MVQILLALGVSVLLFVNAAAVTFFGHFTGIPEDALLAAESQTSTPILNGLNFQSRFDVVFRHLDTSPIELIRVPVKENFRFVAELEQGSYRLEISSHDFNVEKPWYRVFVAGDSVSVYEDDISSPGYNESSKTTVSISAPLTVQLNGYTEYYESHEGKLTAMLMGSPLGPIFRNRTLTMLFIVSILVMVGPSILSYFNPELAAELKDPKASQPQESSEPSDKAPEALDESTKSTSLGRAAKADAKKRR